MADNRPLRGIQRNYDKSQLAAMALDVTDQLGQSLRQSGANPDMNALAADPIGEMARQKAASRRKNRFMQNATARNAT